MKGALEIGGHGVESRWGRRDGEEEGDTRV